MTFTIPARRAEILSSHIAPIAGYLDGAVGDAYVHNVNRFGNSTTLYADSLTQTDTTNGLIFRAGYGASGAQTWMIDITKNKVVIKNGTIYCQGPRRYDVEAYAPAADLNSQGLYECDTDVTAAINLAATAIRAAQIVSATGLTATTQEGCELVFNSPVYKLSSTANLTKLLNVLVRSACGYSRFFSGDGWTTSGAWDSGVSGSGTTVAATNAPMFDLTGTSGSRFFGISLRAQPISGISLGPATTAPAVKPGAGWLVSSTETRAAGVFSSNANSNNLTFELCDALGWSGRSPWICQNTQILTFEECGSQQYENTSSARAFYLGRTVLGTVDSPFYPHPSVPADGDEQMAQTALVASDVTFRRCEFHDMTRSYAGTADTQSSLTGSILFDGIYNVKMYGGPQSSSGRAHIELTSDCRSLILEGVEFYDDGEGIGAHTTGTKPSSILYNTSCNQSTPASDVVIRNCWFNTPLASAVLSGTGGAQFLRFKLENNQYRGTPTLVTLTAGYASAAETAFAGDCYIDANGLAIQVGAAGNGGIGGGVKIGNVGSLTVAGTNLAEYQFTSTGDRIYNAILTANAYKGAGTIATTGLVRAANNVVVAAAMNAAGTQPIALMATDASNNAIFGSATQANGALLHGNLSAGLVVNGTTRLTTSSTGADVTGALTATTSIAATTFLSVGASLPASGAGRFGNATGLHWRGSGGADINGIGLDASDLLQIGQSTNLSGIVMNAANTVTIQNAGTTRFLANGTGIGVFAATPVAKQTVTGSRGGNAALASLLTAMASFGWITDSSS